MVANFTIIFHKTLVIEFVQIPNLATRNGTTWFKEIVVSYLHLLHYWLALGIFSSDFIDNTSFLFDNVMLTKCDGATTSINESTGVNDAAVTEIYLALKFCGLANYYTWWLCSRPTWCDGASSLYSVWWSCPSCPKSGSVGSSLTRLKSRPASITWSAWLTLHRSSRSFCLHRSSWLISLHCTSWLLCLHRWASVTVHLNIDIWFLVN